MKNSFSIGVSWKMNKTLAEASEFMNKVLAAPELTAEDCDLFVMVPFTMLREVRRLAAGSRVEIGAQNMHWADRGAWTGEISPLMVRDCGANLVELGHSERRMHFGEIDETVSLKVAAAVRHGLKALVCVGEDRTTRDAGNADVLLANQVRSALKDAGESAAGEVAFAYEPVWAIGEGGEPASADYAEMRHQVIKHVASEILGEAPRVLYGGSVSRDNCQAFAACDHVDGLFVGRSAWMAEGYLDIIRRCSAAVSRTV